MGEKAGSSLKGRPSQDRHFANELEVPKPKGGDGKNMQHNTGQRKRPSSSLWQKILRNFPACSSSKPKQQSFDYACLSLPWADKQPFDRLVRRICLLQFSKYCKATLRSGHELWGREYQKEF